MHFMGAIIADLFGRMRGPLLIVLMCAAIVFTGIIPAGSAPPTHMDDLKNPEGCAGCHAGKGVPGTGLLKATREALCFRCHGSFGREGFGRAASDIESVLTKVSRHPVLETSFYHVNGEVMPEEKSYVPRHVACADCHKAHSSDAQIPWRGSRGYIPGLDKSRQPGLPPMGVRLKYATTEYEMCYLCHSESTNLTPGARNMAELFDSSNESYHPVEAPGRNSFVPSLVRQLSINSRITCTNCHGNNDPLGAKGPHGSDFEPILIANYRKLDGPEDPLRYELCYMCHDRRSILGDESFIKHNLHVVTGSSACFSCHASHGSVDNQHLIEFNFEVVLPSPTSGGPVYLPGAPGNPRCFLLCHEVDHNNVDVGGNPWP